MYKNNKKLENSLNKSKEYRIGREREREREKEMQLFYYIFTMNFLRCKVC
jgi:hypothetical protein